MGIKQKEKVALFLCPFFTSFCIPQELQNKSIKTQTDRERENKYTSLMLLQAYHQISSRRIVVVEVELPAAIEFTIFILRYAFISVQCSHITSLFNLLLFTQISQRDTRIFIIFSLLERLQILEVCAVHTNESVGMYIHYRHRFHYKILFLISLFIYICMVMYVHIT